MTKSEGLSKFSSILSEIRKLADEALELSDARRLQEQVLSDEEVRLSEKRRLTERDQSDQAFDLEKKHRITEHKHSEKAFTLSKKQNSLEISLAHQEIDKLNRQIIEILESTHETCLFFYDYHLIYVNTQAQNLYWPQENIIGKTLSELLPNDISEEFLRKYQDDKIPLSSSYFESDNFQVNKCFKFFFYPSESGFLVCFSDITRTKQIEKELLQKDKHNESKK